MRFVIGTVHNVNVIGSMKMKGRCDLSRDMYTGRW